MFCGGCGKELREGVQFCPSCGRKVESTKKEKKPKKKLAVGLSIGFLLCLGILMFVIFGLGVFSKEGAYVIKKITSDQSNGRSNTVHEEHECQLDEKGNKVKVVVTRNGESVASTERLFDGNGYTVSCTIDNPWENVTAQFDFQNEIDGCGRIVKSTARDDHGLKTETVYSYFGESDSIETVSCRCSIDSASYDEVRRCYYASIYTYSMLPDEAPAWLVHGALLDIFNDKKTEGFAAARYSQEGVLLSLVGDNVHLDNYGEPSSLEQRKGQSFSYHRDEAGDTSEIAIEKKWDENGNVAFMYRKENSAKSNFCYESDAYYSYEHILLPSHAVSIFGRLHNG